MKFPSHLNCDGKIVSEMGHPNVDKFSKIMMTSSNGNIFRVSGLLWRESTGHRWIPLTKASNAELWCFLWSAPEKMAEQTIETLVILDVIALIMTSLWCGNIPRCFSKHKNHVNDCESVPQLSIAFPAMNFLYIEERKCSGVKFKRKSKVNWVLFFREKVSN